MPRFFVPSQALSSQTILLTGENANHAKVLRLRPNDAVTVCDGRGTDYHCTVTQISAGQVSLRVLDSAPAASEPAVRTSVYMAFAKADKFEHVVQKATELGAWEIVAFPSARCVSRPDAKTLAKKLERWQKIALSAAEQSRRGRIPQVLVMDSYRQALERAAQADLAVTFYENEEQFTLSSAIAAAPFQTVALMTGPEGGYEPEEIALAQSLGIRICTLGRRILRCETAPLCALSALMFASGEY